MGQRSGTKTIVAILQAFLKQKTWTQVDLARHVDVGVEALRKRLDELRDSGFPLDEDKEHPHVYWSIPKKGWYPGAVIFESERVPVLLRQLLRVPRSKARDELIRMILDAGPRPSPAVPTVLTSQWTELEEELLSRIEDAQANKVTLEIKYRSAKHPEGQLRYVSVQRVVVGPPARFIAYNHKIEKLGWFRVSNVERAWEAKSIPFQKVDAAEVEVMLSQSVDGFCRGDAIECSFFVREPEALWVERNLPVPITPVRVEGGMRFTTTTAGVLRLARFVVGLGEAARVETPELAAHVRELARGALEASGAREEAVPC
jgi:predicted DNA-binding transcriptional regulator YafY